MLPPNYFFSLLLSIALNIKGADRHKRNRKETTMTTPQSQHSTFRRVRRWLIWVSRIAHCRGFGIQSPSDYRFVCNVVNDRREYEEYARLLQETPFRDAEKLKLCRLYFRIAKHLKPRVCYNCVVRWTADGEQRAIKDAANTSNKTICASNETICASDETICASDETSFVSDATRYIAAGSPNVGIVNIVCDEEQAAFAEIMSHDDKPDIVFLDTNSVSSSVIEVLIDHCHSRSVMIVEGIKRSKKARAIWRQIVGDKRTIITFDLYYCGIAFFDTSRYKQNYIVNF